MLKTRDPVFDIMKGFAILSVIIIHTEAPWRLYHFLSFFHVPLFFLISGYFAKECSVYDFVKNGAKRILIPLVFTSVLMLPVVYVLDLIFDTHSIDVAVKSLVWGIASFSNPLGAKYILSVGPLWFLWALFFVKAYWLIFQKIKGELFRGVIIVILAIAANQSKDCITLPFSIQASIGALGFFYSGFLIKKYTLLKNEMGRKLFPFCLSSLVYCIGFSKLDVNLCNYGAFYIIDVLAVVSAFLILHTVITKYKAETRLWSLINFIGRYSLVALCVHAIDQNILVYWFPYKIWSNFQVYMTKRYLKTGAFLII